MVPSTIFKVVLPVNLGPTWSWLVKRRKQFWNTVLSLYVSLESWAYKGTVSQDLTSSIFSLLNSIYCSPLPPFSQPIKDLANKSGLTKILTSLRDSHCIEQRWVSYLVLLHMVWKIILSSVKLTQYPCTFAIFKDEKTQIGLSAVPGSAQLRLSVVPGLSAVPGSARLRLSVVPGLSAVPGSAQLRLNVVPDIQYSKWSM